MRHDTRYFSKLWGEPGRWLSGQRHIYHQARWSEFNALHCRQEVRTNSWKVSSALSRGQWHVNIHTKNTFETGLKSCLHKVYHLHSNFMFQENWKKKITVILTKSERRGREEIPAGVNTWIWKPLYICHGTLENPIKDIKLEAIIYTRKGPIQGKQERRKTYIKSKIKRRTKSSEATVREEEIFKDAVCIHLLWAIYGRARSQPLERLAIHLLSLLMDLW